MARLEKTRTGMPMHNPSGTSDIGPGTATSMSQGAADALGLPVEAVRFELGEPGDPGLGAWLREPIRPLVEGPAEPSVQCQSPPTAV